MAISYPLTFPSGAKIVASTFRQRRAIAVSRSPFTYQQQVFRYSGAMWEAEISLAPMKRADAEKWTVFFSKLDGPYGTFLMGDPDAKQPLGTITSSDSLIVSGSAGSRTLSASLPLGKTILAGSYIQLGTSSDATLHKLLNDYTGTGGTQSNVLDIWPALRKDRSSVSAVFINPVGNWRLASNETEWSSDQVSRYGISFSCVEAL